MHKLCDVIRCWIEANVSVAGAIVVGEHENNKPLDDVDSIEFGMSVVLDVTQELDELWCVIVGRVDDNFAQTF